MSNLVIRATLTDKILVSRESAQRLAEPLRQATAANGREILVDFTGVEGMAPSFLDEFLGVLHDAVGVGTRIRFSNQPARLSLKFEAVAKGRGLRLTEESGGSWVFAAETPPVSDRDD